MSTVVAQKAQAADVGAQIVVAMRSMGVAPIPRNYQLFYEAYLGANPALTKDLAALGARATQEELDDLINTHIGGGGMNVIEQAHLRLSTELDALLRILRQEQNSLESYGRLLGETQRGSTPRPISPSIWFVMPSTCWPKPLARRSLRAKKRRKGLRNAPANSMRFARNWMSTSGSPIPIPSPAFPTAVHSMKSWPPFSTMRCNCH